MGFSQMLERAARSLAAGCLTGKQGIGINRGSLPPSLARRHAVDLEMKVWR